MGSEHLMKPKWKEIKRPWVSKKEVEDILREYDADIAAEMETMQGQIKWLMEEVRKLNFSNDILKERVKNLVNGGKDGEQDFDPRKPL